MIVNFVDASNTQEFKTSEIKESNEPLKIRPNFRLIT